MNPRVSIVVINKDDRGIARTLAALTLLAPVVSGDAAIVVVDASEGRLDDIMTTFPTVNWIPFQPVPHRVTIPHQRNVGVRVSAGDTIVFIDASCVPAAGWLTRLCEPLWSGRETVVAGSHRSAGGRRLRDQATLRLTGERYLQEAPTLNFALTRAVYDQLGGFDESFDYGSDVDLCWRAVDAGHRIRYEPDAEVSHDWGDHRSEMRRSYVYGRARARLYLKHPARWRSLFGRDAQVLAYPLYLLLLPLSLRRPCIHLVLAVALLRNRDKLPVRTVADHLVYGTGVLIEVGTLAARSAMPGLKRTPVDLQALGGAGQYPG